MFQVKAKDRAVMIGQVTAVARFSRVLAPGRLLIAHGLAKGGAGFGSAAEVLEGPAQAVPGAAGITLTGRLIGVFLGDLLTDRAGTLEKHHRLGPLPAFAADSSSAVLLSISRRISAAAVR